MTQYEIMPHQEATINSLMPNRRMILGSAPGTGKSFCCIIEFLRYKSLKNHKAKALFIVPAFLLQNWLYEFKKFAPSLVLQVVTKPNHVFNSEADVVILSYDRARRSEKVLLDYIIAQKAFTHLYMDESHNIKNPKALVTKAILGKTGIAKQFYYLRFVTGTPFPKSIQDAYLSFSYCTLGKLGTKKQFLEKYANFKTTYVRGFEELVPTTLRKDMRVELAEFMKPYLIRYTLDDIEDGVPGFEEQDIWLEHSKETMKLTKDNKELLDVAMKQIEEGKMPKNMPSISTFRKDLAFLKVENALPHIENLVKQDIPLVIFAVHVEAVHRLAGHLSKYFLGMCTGETPTGQRQQIVDDFQEGKTNIIIATIKSLGVGFNITRATHAIFLESAYNGDDNRQAMARIRRKGQKNHCVFQFLLLPGVDEENAGIDELVLKGARRKSKDSDNFWNEVNGKPIETEKSENEIIWD